MYFNGVDKLDDGKEKSKKEKTKEEKEAAKCPACGSLWPSGSDTCSHCGHVRQRKSMIEAVPGEMKELEPQSREAKQNWWSMCQWKVANSGWSKSRALATYRNKFGVWPKGLVDTPMMPDLTFEKKVKADLIRYLKGKK